MHVVDPSKLRAIESLLAPDEFTLHVVNGVPLSELYARIARENFGLHLTVLASRRGWHCGFLHVEPNLVDSALGCAAQALRSATDALVDAVEAFERGEITREEAAPIIRRFKEFGDGATGTEALAREFLLRNCVQKAVFGVSHRAVALAVLARAIDPRADVFLTATEFLERYTPADWQYLCSAFAAILPEDCLHDPNQLLLFSDQDDDAMNDMWRACSRALDGLAESEPDLVLGEDVSWSQIVN